MKQRVTNKGFTLIELLVSVTIIGVVSVIALTTINPVEQINKTLDSTHTSILNAFLDANTRYYTTHHALPWQTSTDGGSNCYGYGQSFSALPLKDLNDCLITLAAEGEIKQGFTGVRELATLYATYPNPNGANEVVICYKPKSKSEQKNNRTMFTANGVEANNCMADGGTEECYNCRFNAFK